MGGSINVHLVAVNEATSWHLAPPELGSVQIGRRSPSLRATPTHSHQRDLGRPPSHEAVYRSQPHRRNGGFPTVSERQRRRRRERPPSRPARGPQRRPPGGRTPQGWRRPCWLLDGSRAGVARTMTIGLAGSPRCRHRPVAGQRRCRKEGSEDYRHLGRDRQWGQRVVERPGDGDRSGDRGCDRGWQQQCHPGRSVSDVGRVS